MEKQGDKSKFLEDFRNRVFKIANNTRQKDIAERIGLDPKELSQIFTGRKILTIDHVLKIAAAYHCSTDYLLTGSEQPSPKPSAAAPSYPDLLRCIDALVSRGLAEIVDYKDTETETMRLANSEWWESHDTRKALVFNTNSITQTLNEYLQIRKTIKAADSKQFAEMLKKLWLEKEMKKDCPLTKDGMRRLSALRDFADTIPE